MLFDDMLATILSQAADTPAARDAMWRQLVDLLAQQRSAADPALAEAAFARVAALRDAVPLAVRRGAAAAIGHGRLPPALVALFADDIPQVAAPVLARVRLGDQAWIDLLPRLGPMARSLLRHREDLSAPVRRALDSFGAVDLILSASEEAALAADAIGAAMPALPEEAEAESQLDQPGYEIRELVARIEAYRSVPRIAEPPVAMPPVAPGGGTFRFETDDLGLIRWVDGVPRGPLIGETVAEAGTASHGVDAQAAGAYRRRAAFRDARLRLAGTGLAAGDWRISAVPMFAAEDGRFTGYRGTGRRPRPDEEAGGRAVTGLFGSALPPDSLRQLVHELRTPINAVAGFAEMIERQMLGPAAEAYRDRATHIVAQAQRLLVAVDDLDLAARLDTDRLPLDHDRIDAGALLADAARHLAPLAEAHDVLLSIEAEAEPAEVVGDRFAIERMIGRLAAGIVGLAAAGETIRLVARSTTADASALSIVISRPAALLGKSETMLLDPGDGLEDDWPDAPALGLGFTLRLVRNLAAASQGRLEIEADHFRLLLPAAGGVARAGGSA